MQVDMSGKKRCTRCGAIKTLKSFSTEQRAKDGKRSACKRCLTNEQKKRYVENPPPYEAKKRRQKSLAVYGLSLEDFDNMLKEQDYKCAICRIEEKYSAKQRFHVDHDHDTGKVRALLCNRCNKGLGMFQDSSEFCDKAADYLREHGK